MPKLLSRISELWSSFSLHVANRPIHIAPVGSSFSCLPWLFMVHALVTRHISLLVHHLKLVLDGLDISFSH
ncbi:hypothetical protein H5410_027689 [Solanum commersonii]|uniref:Uncharacterized protein n=1 Tax=Solanum commersonii TaxID=4109 RepID=A0A9J5Z1Y7_SOLCO|nr:hypothetical protein H5410_027689 [Solanum commersonii]